MTIIHNDIEITYPNEISREEAISYVDGELDRNPKMRLVSLEIILSADKVDVELHPVYDTICRVRRITGYLSTLPKFNDAKKAEAKDRVSHFDELKVTSWPL